ncbi:MAG: DUF58 domain-containing protein [Xanthomonadales bacterium]|nr:DUF58 domain-containing protein [Xanthomonadales bacterium]
MPALTRLRAPERLPIALHRRRIYVLPSAFGVAFAVLLAVMLLGALNYANNPALLLTCVLAAAAWMSLFAGFRTLAGLELEHLEGDACHAGDGLGLRLAFVGGARARAHLQLRLGEAHAAFAVPAGETVRVELRIPTRRRGWMAPGRLKLWTTQPLGLFTVWSWLHPDASVLIYPAIEQPAPPLPQAAGGLGQRQLAGGDEYAGLRDYRHGDPLRRIAWKASARLDALRVREDEVVVGHALSFDYDAIGGLDHEARIRRLTAWVIAAESAAQNYTLVTPQESIGPGLGSHHRHACLRALALLPHAPA